MIILGINSAYHEPAAALVVDGRLVFFGEEERFNRDKHGKPALVDNAHVLPERAIRAALATAGCTLDQVDLIGYSFAREGRRRNLGVDLHLIPGRWGSEVGENAFHESLLRAPLALESFGASLGATRPVEDRWRWIPHHMAHAASAFLDSPFDHALVMAIDGIGEFDSLLMAEGRGGELKPLLGLPYPHSLGFLWEKICQFLGFSEYDACKVMGLSSYGDPSRFALPFARLARIESDGTFTVDLETARYRSPSMTALEALFGFQARQAGDPLNTLHHDLAAALQHFTEEALLALVRRGKQQTGASHLCLAGGVALNCVANARLEKEAGFEELFVQPSANDAGSALGAALHLWTTEAGGERRWRLDHAYWGPGYTREQIQAAIQARGLSAVEYPDHDAVIAETVELVAAGNVVGWFQGRMEMGPRALGNRTLLADPRRADMREILNHKVKHREPFRPFAPSVLVEKAPEWFEMPCRTTSTDFMLFAYPTKPEKRSLIPAVVHVDGTSRIQTVRRETNPLYHRLISAFERKTGVPMVLNTSFNDSEPIVCSPEDALNTFLKTRIDAVVLDRFLIRKEVR